MTIGNRFPVIPTETLDGRPLLLPDAIDGRVGLLVLAFRRSAQSIVDSWMANAMSRFGEHPGFACFEVPMIGGAWRMISGYIDSGMRAGVPPEHHHLVATYYGDASRYRSALGITDSSLAYAYLLDRSGMIVAEGSGETTEAERSEIFALMDKLLSESSDST